VAAIGGVQSRYLDRDNAYRRQLASWYQEQLGQIDGCRMVPVAADCESSRHLFQILINNRDELISSLHTHAIYPGVHYRDNTDYRMYAHASGSCPKARQASSQLLSLPMHLGLTFADIAEIAAVVRKYAK